MEVYCTRPTCPRPVNQFTDLDDNATLKTVQQKFCTSCGMPLMLIGRYVTTRLLGQGGFGAAFLARDRYTPAMRQCVVKQFQPAGDFSPAQLQTALELFEREGQVLEELGRHPQIPDLLAYFELDVPGRVAGKPDRFFYLAQEFIDGQNLEQELEQKGKLSEAEVLELLKEIVKVLGFVHANDAIHRDIKPSNIMRNRKGQLFLLDFGAVKQKVTGAAVRGKGGKASTGIYSMGFAPPEQMAGDQVYPATDFYALAVTCITLLTGKQPSELYDSYSNGWNWRTYAQVSDRLEAVLNRMLQPSPSQRFQSAAEILAALTPVAPTPVAPTPAPAPTPIPPPIPPVPPSIPPVPPPIPPRQRPTFSTLELLTGAAFTGFEGGLITIVLLSFGTVVGSVAALVAIGGLVFVQSRRIIENKDLLIIVAITLAIVFFVPAAKIGGSIVTTVILAAFAGLLATAVTILFRLIYTLLSRVV